MAKLGNKEIVGGKPQNNVRSVLLITALQTKHSALGLREIANSLQTEKQTMLVTDAIVKLTEVQRILKEVLA